MKKFLVIYILVLTVLSVILFKWSSGTLKLESLTYGAGETVASIEVDIIAEQTEWIKTHPKYKQVLKTTVNGITYWVDEYVMPDGSAGYQAFIEKADKTVKSFGVGEEKIYRDFDWKTVQTSVI